MPQVEQPIEANEALADAPREQPLTEVRKEGLEAAEGSADQLQRYPNNEAAEEYDEQVEAAKVVDQEAGDDHDQQEAAFEKPASQPS